MSGPTETILEPSSAVTARSHHGRGAGVGAPGEGADDAPGGEEGGGVDTGGGAVPGGASAGGSLDNMRTSLHIASLVLAMASVKWTSGLDQDQWTVDQVDGKIACIRFRAVEGTVAADSVAGAARMAALAHTGCGGAAASSVPQEARELESSLIRGTPESSGQTGLAVHSVGLGCSWWPASGRRSGGSDQTP